MCGAELKPSSDAKKKDTVNLKKNGAVVERKTFDSIDRKVAEVKVSNRWYSSSPSNVAPE